MAAELLSYESGPLAIEQIPCVAVDDYLRTLSRVTVGDYLGALSRVRHGASRDLRRAIQEERYWLHVTSRPEDLVDIGAVVEFIQRARDL